MQDFLRHVSPHMFSIGDVVRKLRLLRDWTIDDLARRADLNKMTVSSIERGQNHTRASLNAVGRALSVGDAAGLEAVLRQWATKLAAATSVSAEVAEWLELRETLAQEPEALRDFVRFLRRYVRDRPSQPPTNTAGQSARPKSGPAARRRRSARGGHR